MLAGLLMVKNESRILERCVESLRPVVDVLVVVDTGSTDDTVAIAKRLGARVAQHEWKNFGHNRTLSFQAAKELAPECNWALAIDADMKLVCPGDLRACLKTDAAGCSLLQVNGGAEYNNVRLMRLDRPWVSKGATHEYWTCKSGVVDTIPREVAWIDDVGDGGAKSDKFERDEQLLKNDLADDPDEPRSFFYLANTLQCQGRLEEAAEWYKKRVECRAAGSRSGSSPRISSPSSTTSWDESPTPSTGRRAPSSSTPSETSRCSSSPRSAASAATF
jgi:hypothetical protein